MITVEDRKHSSIMARQGHDVQRRSNSSSSKGCCSVPVLKCCLAVYNLLLLACGLCLVGVAVWSVASKHQHVAVLASSAYQSVTYMLLLAGFISLVAVALGCVALANEDRCTLIAYIVVVVLVLTMEGVAGVVAYVYEEQVLPLLTQSLPATIRTGYFMDDGVTAAVDNMQEQFRCCGGLTYTEWRGSLWLQSTGGASIVPDSCCKSITDGCGARDHPSNIWYTGCIHGLAASLEEQLLLLGALGCGLALLQVLGVATACCLYLMLAKAP